MRGLQQHLREKRGAVEVPQPTSTVFVEAFAGDMDEDAMDEMEANLPEELRDEGSSSREAAAVSEEDKRRVTKMRVKLGHPSRESFLRFLRAGRVRYEVLRWVAKEFKCATCAAQALPKAPRPAVVPKTYTLRVAVGMDLFYVPDLRSQRSLPVLNMVDLGANYYTRCWSCWRTSRRSPFGRTWCRTFGVPQYLSLDEGLEFRGEFTRWCSDFGTIVFRAAARSPWQNGKVERHGGLAKSMIGELALLLQECECEKNRFMNRSGYSPVQRQIGQWPRLPGSLMSDEMLDPALQVQCTSDDFSRLLELRQLAQDAFVRVASKDAAAKSLRARSRPQPSFKTGDLVYVRRKLFSNKNKEIVEKELDVELRGLGLATC